MNDDPQQIDQVLRASDPAYTALESKQVLDGVSALAREASYSNPAAPVALTRRRPRPVIVLSAVVGIAALGATAAYTGPLIGALFAPEPTVRFTARVPLEGDLIDQTCSVVIDLVSTPLFNAETTDDGYTPPEDPDGTRYVEGDGGGGYLVPFEQGSYSDQEFSEAVRFVTERDWSEAWHNRFTVPAIVGHNDRSEVDTHSWSSLEASARVEMTAFAIDDALRAAGLNTNGSVTIVFNASCTAAE
ncbi:hypothetical protein [Lysinibacter cavernae]|uniref:Uncharacterized protein n=1 Tax=Lysinibacter cavernae TaxID=1640652 RepID=A0A7X5R0U7_9MICO|nr:hypothetical protein [Lysinibacter cavernae]NIH53315.1 hypothetical protein [Lysinibacter cavernae]